MPVRRVGGGGRAVGVRRPTVVVRPMPIAPMMMTGMMTGMMMGSMMAGRRNQAANCHHEETSTTIVVVQPFPGTVVAFHPEDGKVMFQTIPIGVAIPPGCHIVKTPEQVGVPILIKHHGKIEYKLIPPGGNVPNGAKIIQIQLQQQPPPPPPGSTIVQIVQPDGQVAYQAIPPGYPIPHGAVIVQMPQPMENNNNNNNDHHHDQDKGLEKVDNSNLPPPLPSPYGIDEMVRTVEGEVKEGQEEVHRDIQTEQPNNGEVPVMPIIDNQPYPGQGFPPQQPQPFPQQMAYPPVQGYPPPQGAYPPQYPQQPQPYPQQMAYPPVQGYPPPQGAYPPQYPQQPYASQVQPRPQSEQFPPNQYQAQQPPRPQSQQIPNAYQSQPMPPQQGAKIPPAWVPDVQCGACTTCNLPFTFKRRRHHCRNCGKIFCESCSHSMCMIPEYGFREAVRVCDHCYESITGRKPNPVPPTQGDGCIIS